MPRRVHRRHLLGGAVALPLLTACGGALPPPCERVASEAPGDEPAEEPFASLRGFTDGIAPPNAEEWKQQRERARRHMQEAGLRALVIESGPSMQYFSGARWRRSERPFVMVMFAEGDPVWISPAFERLRAEAQIGGVGELRLWHEDESPYALVADALRARGAEGAVAVESTLRWFIVDGLEQALGAEVKRHGGDVVRRCRIVKTAPELARMRRANEATKEALKLSAGLLREGMDEDDLSAILREAQQAAGLTQVWTLVLFGPNAAHPHGTGERRPIVPGDVVLVDTGGDLHGYKSDITRTWAMGRPSDELRKVWNTVLRAQSAAMEFIRPGMRCEQADEAARRVVTEAGFGEGYATFTHRLGHGIGMQGHEDPYMVRGNDTLLEPGMTMSNEPGIYMPGKLGVRIEDICAVTETGVEVFGPRSPSIDDPFG